jgi:protein-tyrosine phosphatase
VYIHCKIGYSRSAAVAGAFLIASHQAANVDDAVARLHEVRPSIVIRSEAMKALRDFAQRGSSLRVLSDKESSEFAGAVTLGSLIS